MKTTIKICGITNLEDASFATNLGADALGFIFTKNSPRYISVQTARDILQKLPPFVVCVGVFMNNPIDEVLRIAQEIKLDFIQFHGSETSEIFHEKSWKIIKSISSKVEINPFRKSQPDYFLLDSKIGGSGKKADWRLANELRKVGKFILAGGLTPKNVENAIKLVHPDGVDVSSGVESELGKKDYVKLKTFIDNVRKVNASIA